MVNLWIMWYYIYILHYFLGHWTTTWYKSPERGIKSDGCCQMKHHRASLCQSLHIFLPQTKACMQRRPNDTYVAIIQFLLNYYYSNGIEIIRLADVLYKIVYRTGQKYCLHVSIIIIACWRVTLSLTVHTFLSDVSLHGHHLIQHVRTLTADLVKELHVCQ